jgi:hypothetical protein
MEEKTCHSRGGLVVRRPEEQLVGAAGDGIHGQLEGADPHPVHRPLIVGAVVAAHLEPAFRNVGEGFIRVHHV